VTPLSAGPDADPILFLHGQPGSSHDWARVSAELGADVRTIAVDRPGWDRRSRPAGLPGNAAAALAVLEARGIDRATVVGHSFGGAVAAWLAAHRPERVGALVLVAPSANLASLYRLDRWLAAPVAGYLACAAALSVLGVVLGNGGARRRIASLLTLVESYLEHAGHALRNPLAWRAFTTEQQALIRELPELERSLARIAAPTTIVTGAADRIVRPSAATRLVTQIPGAELVVLEHANHLLVLQQARRLAEIIMASHVSVG
jgi:pimeloyl-ACP methyl ester carboxylesterase